MGGTRQTSLSFDDSGAGSRFKSCTSTLRKFSIALLLFVSISDDRLVGLSAGFSGSLSGSPLDVCGDGQFHFGLRVKSMKKLFLFTRL